MNRRFLLSVLTVGTLLVLGGAPRVGAETLSVQKYRHKGPFPVQTPFLIDSVNVQSKAYSPVGATGWIAFDFENSRFAPVTVIFEGDVKEYHLLLDGKPANGPVKLEPGTHRAEINYLLEPGKEPQLKVSLETPAEGVL
ncbi:MAG: hypothetical protein IKX34_07860, partial [Bacteroidales bacterium]|nr:hypothetical protein [Bacteroidales bacterium]